MYDLPTELPRHSIFERLPIIKLMTFKDQVLKVVKSIPIGQVLTYSKVAELAGNPKAARAVGQILNKNYNPEIPCHRVIAKNGIGGYNRGIENKITLLRSESIKI